MMWQRFSLAQLIAWTALAAGVALVLVQPLPASQSLAMALAVAAIGLWATGVIPEPITAVFFFTAAMLLKVAPAAVVFGGFEFSAGAVNELSIALGFDFVKVLTQSNRISFLKNF